MSGRIKALLFLALALLRTLWRRAVGRRIDGLARFRANYADDGLSSLTEAERRGLGRFGRCIACGRCDRGDGARVLATHGRFRGTMGLVLAASRSMPDFRAAAEGFEQLTSAELEAKEKVCPTHVPIREIAAFVRAHAGSARVSLPASRGEKRIASSFPPARAPTP